jgi:hypothetical protein
MEDLDDLDLHVVEHLGYAVVRSQLFEFAMLKLLEAQQHDLAVPLEERWSEIERWLTKLTAGRAGRKLGVPEAVADDLRRTVKRRITVVHHAWPLYAAAREKHGDDAGAAYLPWLEDQAAMLGYAFNGLMALVEAAHASSPAASESDTMETLWRSAMPEPVEPLAFPWPTTDDDAVAPAQ